VSSDGRYKWIALSNTTLGVLMATLDASIVIIAMPAIFRGIGLDPLAPANIGYLLWMILGYLLVSAVLVVALGRLGDMFGRVRMYNFGFVVFSAASLALSLDPFGAERGALWLIAWRIVQAVGGAMLTANSAAILTDAFPPASAVWRSASTRSPPGQRGVASGMRSTLQNSGTALSIGVFFSLMITGLAASLPLTLSAGLRDQGVPSGVAASVAHLPPVSTLFAAFLGDNPVGHLLAPTGVLGSLPAHNVAVLTGKRFFPELISGPFHHGLVIVFGAAACMAAVAALASLLRGRRYFHDEQEQARPAPPAQVRRIAR
jgi:MFS family permease